MAGGFDHLGVLRRELRGNQRVREIHFKELEDLYKEGFEPQLLWRRVDSLEEARSTRGHGSRRECPACRVSLFVWAGWHDAALVELPSEQSGAPSPAVASPSRGPSPILASVQPMPSRANSNERELRR
jgi:hypothetical protein